MWVIVKISRTKYIYKLCLAFMSFEVTTPIQIGAIVLEKCGVNGCILYI